MMVDEEDKDMIELKELIYGMTNNQLLKYLVINEISTNISGLVGITKKLEKEAIENQKDIIKKIIEDNKE